MLVVNTKWVGVLSGYEYCDIVLSLENGAQLYPFIALYKIEVNIRIINQRKKTD